jgi:hypothetical protein
MLCCLRRPSTAFGDGPGTSSHVSTATLPAAGSKAYSAKVVAASDIDVTLQQIPAAQAEPTGPAQQPEASSSQPTAP